MPAKKGNKYAVGNDGGRPPLYESPDQLQGKIDEYFDIGRNTVKVAVGFNFVDVPVYTICGLAYYLGFESRQSFYDYEKKEEFAYIIKKARLRIEMIYEQNLQHGQPTGSIFALKNMGWKDKTERDQNINITVPKIITTSEKGKKIIEKLVTNE